ncbi:hypothetical protein H2198_002631 [Neophaeococcomyces mojaviensis]|uniref:Uncharacterized protein n=1 Tax=Neophaeococcomyces mojaviensis TaxID=3383035 RepID=A0ACC3AE49_9EURO|nr:hypothetical protein H2198_002631 [Knufia sp. JES_112]
MSFQRPYRYPSHISALSKQTNDTYDVSDIDPSDVAGPVFDQAGVSQARPAMAGATTQSPGAKQRMLPRDSETLPSTNHAVTMEALTAAIRQGLNTSVADPQRPPPTRKFTEPTTLRMPFQEDPPSPSSMYTDVTANQRHRESVPVSAYHGYNPRDSKPSTIAEHEVDYEKSGLDMDLPTPTSVNPIFAGEQPGMSAKIPFSKRPPKLNINAVREMEARGSITSLPDLIKRATRLASNLDRGKTASRLGHLDMFGTSDKLTNGHVRDSTYSDVLAAFPPAGVGTPNRDRPNTMWPHGEKQFMASKSSLGMTADTRQKTPRKCCGLSPLVFVLILVVVVLLVVAAVLIPIFLIVLPRQHHQDNPSQCSSSHSCLNGGVSIFTNNACSCVCVDGFTGSVCSVARGPDCTTHTLTDNAITYENATIGTSVLPIFSTAQSSFNIVLNETKLLSIFSSNNLSCASENSLIDFASATTTRSRRFVMVPGMMTTDTHVPTLNLPVSESEERKRFVIVDGLEDAAEHLALRPTKIIQRRDDTMSKNGIVFATSTDVNTVPTPSQSIASATNPAASAVTSTAALPSATQTAVSNVTDEQVDFAATVVLYVLQNFQQISVAVAANQAIASYFKESSHNNNTVVVVSGDQRIDADFDKLWMVLANGTIIGGT